MYARRTGEAGGPLQAGKVSDVKYPKRVEGRAGSVRRTASANFKIQAKVVRRSENAFIILWRWLFSSGFRAPGLPPAQAVKRT